jgi:hypothetical protein
MAGTINITIDPLGNANVEVDGMTGASCKDATRAVEQALAGGQVGVDTVYKGEFYAADTDEEQNEHVQF